MKPRGNGQPNLPRTHQYLEEVSEIAEKLDRRSIDNAISILYRAWKTDNQVFTIGNGGSARSGRWIIRTFASGKEASFTGTRRS
jgi:phosphoheptose isomerase